MGDLIAGRSYTVKKNGVVLATLTADAHGTISFADVAGVLSSVTYTIS